jgi:hypothetical protein
MPRRLVNYISLRSSRRPATFTPDSLRYSSPLKLTMNSVSSSRFLFLRTCIWNFDLLLAAREKDARAFSLSFVTMTISNFHRTSSLHHYHSQTVARMLTERTKLLEFAALFSNLNCSFITAFQRWTLFIYSEPRVVAKYLVNIRTDIFVLE